MKHKKSRKKPNIPFKATVPLNTKGYVLFNPKFDVMVVTRLLPKDCTMMLIKGTTEDFKEDPQQVFRVVHESPFTKLDLYAPKNLNPQNPQEGTPNG